MTMQKNSRWAAAAVTVLIASGAAAVVLGAPAAGAATPRPAPNALAEGGLHSVALASDGTVRTWGYNPAGQLGDNTTTNRTTPIKVKGAGGSGYLTGIAAVAAGPEDSFAVRDDGTVWAWGNNPFGNLGDGTSGNVRHTPVEVLAPSGSGHLTGVIAVAAGDYATYALKGDGTVWAWGYGGDGELGDNLTTASLRPIQVAGLNGVGKLTGVVAIAAGRLHALALRSDGTVWAWGGNAVGQLGNGTVNSKLVPFKVIGEAVGVVAIAAHADDSMALRSDGTIRSWGDNSDGQLGTGNTSLEVSPASPLGLGGSIVGISLGVGDAVVVKADGTVWDWGINGAGQLGDGTRVTSLTPVRVRGLGYGSGVTHVVAGQNQILALSSNGAVRAWGDNEVGELGDTTTIESDEPVRTDGLATIANPALRVLAAPKISGTAAYQHTLSVSKGTWGLPATSWAYRWMRSGKIIAGATKSTYKVTAADKGKKLSVLVAASRPGYPAGRTTTVSRLVSKK
jgi:alpha-tubulin suppressor-like RCC1 family protein